ncbi:probable pyridoxal 5'-phosphate synthase subunit PDX1 [Tanacetum coccineum]
MIKLTQPLSNIIEAVRHVRSVMVTKGFLANMDDDEVFTFAKKIAAPYDLVMQTKQLGRLPVVQFAAGGVATPADAALMMQLGCDGVFVGSGVFKSGDPARRARAIVQAVTHYTDPAMLAEVSCGLGEAMVGLNLDKNVERVMLIPLTCIKYLESHGLGLVIVAIGKKLVVVLVGVVETVSASYTRIVPEGCPNNPR